ncbi:MAG: toxin-antitoxin system YwqK family antitoxin [Planctomycetes bacterium]|nr:toxin-antitoxin system YwqK family antitoxin [Planctomycetota bacterium]
MRGSSRGASVLGPGVLLLFLAVGCASPDAPRLRVVPADQTGSFTTWWSDKVVKEEGNYLHGKREGHVRAYHENGDLQFEGDFVEGVPEGELEFYDPTGRHERTEQWHDARLEGLQTRYDPDGGVLATTEYHRGNPHGEQREYDDQGRLVRQGFWTHGVESGAWRSYEPDGRLSLETWHFVSGGQPAGFVETTFGADGRVVQVIMGRRDGHERGWMTQWYENGRQSAAVAYVDGLQEGPDVSWNAEGVKVREGQLAQDLRQGTWSWWDDQGRLTRTAHYVDGVEVPQQDAAGG